MRDYTTNNYCDFLWVCDLLELKRNSKNEFVFEAKSGKKSIECNILNVIIFGTIVAVNKLGYQVDDGTGVITCKRSEEQFEEIMSLIEQEQIDVLNETVYIQNSLEQTSVTDTSADDSIFNDRCVQIEDDKFDKKSRLKGLQSIWDNIYKSFSSFIGNYAVGDSVVIQGRLYSYLNSNQIYINSIRCLDLVEEILQMSIKLEDGFDQTTETEISKTEVKGEKRMSGFVTFDNILHPHPKISIPTTEVPEQKEVALTSGIMTPNISSTLTFDTFTRKDPQKLIQKYSSHYFYAKELESTTSNGDENYDNSDDEDSGSSDVSMKEQFVFILG